MAGRTKIYGTEIRSGSIPTFALSGGVVSSSAQLPGGIVSSSAQLPGGVVSSSAQVTPLLPGGTVSSSVQINYNTIQNKLSGVVSSSAQITPLLPGGTVSSSAQVSTPSVYTQSIFDSSGTWIKPASGNLVLVECWGAGGGGGRLSSLSDYGGGGGGGAYISQIIPLATLAVSTSVSVGSGGTGATTFAAGTRGGSSSFANIIGYGGSEGRSDTNTNALPGTRLRLDDVSNSNIINLLSTGTPTLRETMVVAAAYNGGIYAGGFGQNSNYVQYADRVQNSMFGGGGGASGFGGAGTSSFGGNGGPVGVSGSAPGGGGGGGNTNVTAGNGGNGRVRLTVW